MLRVAIPAHLSAAQTYGWTLGRCKGRGRCRPIARMCILSSDRTKMSFFLSKRSRSLYIQAWYLTSPFVSSNVSHVFALLILLLTVSKVYAAISSVSLSLLATGIDSVFDIGSNILLFWLHRKAAGLDNNKWPVGGARLETIGNIVYGTEHLFQNNLFWPLASGFLWVIWASNVMGNLNK